MHIIWRCGGRCGGRWWWEEVERRWRGVLIPYVLECRGGVLYKWEGVCAKETKKGRSRSLLSLSSKAAYHFACLSSARSN